MSTPPQPSFMACAVSRTESVSAQHPVPGIMRAGSTPPPTRRSSSSTFSSVERELASELVPKTASPTFWLSSHRHCLTKRSGSGQSAVLNGVATGERTPAMRSVMLKVSFDSRGLPPAVIGLPPPVIGLLPPVIGLLPPVIGLLPPLILHRDRRSVQTTPYQSKTLSRLWKSSVHTPTRGFVSSLAAVQPASCVRLPNAPGVRASTAQVEEVAPSAKGFRSWRRSRPSRWPSSARLATTGSSERYRLERWRTSRPRTLSISK